MLFPFSVFVTNSVRCRLSSRSPQTLPWSLFLVCGSRGLNGTNCDLMSSSALSVRLSECLLKVCLSVCSSLFPFLSLLFTLSLLFLFPPFSFSFSLSFSASSMLFFTFQPFNSLSLSRPIPSHAFHFNHTSSKHKHHSLISLNEIAIFYFLLLI